MRGASCRRKPPGDVIPVAASYLHAGNHFLKPGSPARIDAAQDIQCPRFRKAECDGAKGDGVEIFVIAAMANTTGSLADQLRECASSDDHAFMGHADAASMIETFGTIGGAMRTMRRTY